MTAKLRLYHYWRSSSSWRVRWAFAYKSIACEYAAIDLLSDESDAASHLARNPMGYVPTLEFLGAPEARRYLGESLAIIEWAEETVPSPSLLPGDALARARVRQLAEIINAGTQPLVNPPVFGRHSPDDAERKKWCQHWLHKGLAAYEKLASQTAGRFSVGDTLTMADLCLIPQCYGAARQDVTLENYPTIARIEKAALALESCQASHPERFKP